MIWEELLWKLKISCVAGQDRWAPSKVDPLLLSLLINNGGTMGVKMKVIKRIGQANASRKETQRAQWTPTGLSYSIIVS